MDNVQISRHRLFLKTVSSYCTVPYQQKVRIVCVIKTERRHEGGWQVYRGGRTGSVVPQVAFVLSMLLREKRHRCGAWSEGPPLNVTIVINEMKKMKRMQRWEYGL